MARRPFERREVRAALVHERAGEWTRSERKAERALVERAYASLAAGMRMRDVAAAEDMSPGELWSIIGKSEYADLRRDVYAMARTGVEQRALYHAARAIDRLAELVESDDQRIALAAANAVLDRAGFARVASVETKTVHATAAPLAASAINAAGETLTGLLSAVTVRASRTIAERSWAEDVIDAIDDHDDAASTAHVDGASTSRGDAGHASAAARDAERAGGRADGERR